MSGSGVGDCSDGWQITGYYTPEEGEFSGGTETLTFSDGTTDEFPRTFIHRAQLEGWACTRYGWFLGWSGSRWIKGDAPLNSHGRPLRLGSLATDKGVIQHGLEVTIPSAPGNWGTQVYVADDVGSGITGNHVDIYCGVGAAAHAETLRVTSVTGRVCYAGASAARNAS